MQSFYSTTGKRLFDAALAAAGLVCLSPVLAAAAIAVRLTSGRPVLFRQVRTGRFGKPFLILKFRTMAAAPLTSALPVTASDDSRITPVGRRLRKAKVDELPQLFNVLRGEMSLVGPRPELPHYTALYNAQQQAVFQVRPGITSPASIAFAHEEELLAAQTDRAGYYLNALLPAKLALDAEYAQRVRFSSDLRLILGTLHRLFFRRKYSQSTKKGLSRHHEELV